MCVVSEGKQQRHVSRGLENMDAQLNHKQGILSISVDKNLPKVTQTQHTGDLKGLMREQTAMY